MRRLRLRRADPGDVSFAGASRGSCLHDRALGRAGVVLIGDPWPMHRGLSRQPCAARLLRRQPRYPAYPLGRAVNRGVGANDDVVRPVDTAFAPAVDQYVPVGAVGSRDRRRGQPAGSRRWDQRLVGAATGGRCVGKGCLDRGG